jgi:hypothetical protein
MSPSPVLWRRLDAPGHDACRLVQACGGWRLEGVAAFRHDEGPACLAYHLECDDRWRTRAGAVHGWVGTRVLDIRVTRAPDGPWTLNGRTVPDLDECLDLDLGFTPATNLTQLRRVALAVGQAADVPVAWLDVPAGSLALLDQRYERRTTGSYWYAAPRFGYAALLQVNGLGFVETYPDLWQIEA